MIPLYSSRTAKAGDVDTAFQTTARDLMPGIPAVWRRNPSTAPSPILPWILRAGPWSPEGLADRNAANAVHTSATTTTTTTTMADGVGQAADGLAASLARRGLVRKDPLLARLEKKMQKTAASAEPAASVVASPSPLSDIPASHWTRHKLSDMTPTSWAVFREQLGIELEAVNRRVGTDSATAAGEAPADPAAPHTHSASAGHSTHHSTNGGDSSSSNSSNSSRTYSIDMVRPLRCWEEGGLPYALGKCVAAKYSLPTAIQSQCVPLALKLLVSPGAETAEGASGANVVGCADRRKKKKVDVVAVAETGSGKTMAYLVPLLADIRANRRPNLLSDEDLKSQGPLGLVLVPTRELAEQVAKEINGLLGLRGGSSSGSGSGNDEDAAKHRAALLAWEAEELAGIANVQQHKKQHNLLSEVTVVKLVGGEDVEVQYHALARGAHIVVGTVGQANAMLEQRLLSLGNADFVVIDEADRMIAENQQEELIQVLQRCPLPRQTLLFTATLSAACADIAKKFLSPDGFMLVRTPYRCASIRQNFEMIPLEDAAEAGEAKKSSRLKKQPAATAAVAEAAAARQRGLSPLVHPGKFARLVAWLAYGTSPIVVFAGEKRTCDALQEALRNEKEHLLSQEEEQDMSIEALVGPPPPGLLFVDDNTTTPSGAAATVSRTSSSSSSSFARGASVHAARYAHEAQRRQALEMAAAAKARLQLDNLSSVAVVHADLSQAERRRLVELFRKGQRKVLLTTDLLARGLDVPGLTLVINYDLPWPAAGEAAGEAVVRYIHRIGRTGRAGSSGVTVSFVGLAAGLVQKYRQRFASSASSAASSSSPLHTGGTAGKVYAPGTADSVKQRDRELAELTASATAKAEGFGSMMDEADIDRADDYASDDENGTAEGGDPRQQRQRRRLEEGHGEAASKDKREGQRVFASDEAILKPLWGFLCKCVAANCPELTTQEEAESLLRRQLYGKIDVEPALAAVMADRASQGSKFGVIRN